MLIQLLLHEILESSEERLQRHVYEPGISAEEALILIITGTMDDIATKHTTHLMTELWAMSNHNSLISERIDILYRYHHNLVGSFVKQINPSLNDEQVETVAVFINATTEGTTVVAGHGKTWESKMPFMKSIAAKSLINLVKTITPDEIQRL